MKSLKCILVLTVLIAIQGYADACTIFTLTDGKKVFFANNEDVPLDTAYMHFIPASEGKRGRFLFFHVKDEYQYPQGGLNDRGLAYDITFTPPFKPMTFPAGALEAGEERVMAKVLAESSTVEEALTLIKKYRAPEFGTMQVLLADRKGASAIIGRGKDGGLASLYRAPGEKYQVLTNFDIFDSSGSIGQGLFPCPRYDIANAMLKNDPKPSLENIRSVLSAVHTEGLAVTLYSSVYDLKKGTIRLYYFHNYEESIEMELTDELKKGEHKVYLKETFEKKFGHPVFAETATLKVSESFNKLLELMNGAKKDLEDCRSAKPAAH